MIHDFYYVAFLPDDSMYVLEWDSIIGGKLSMTNVLWSAKPFESQGGLIKYVEGINRRYEIHTVRAVKV